MNRFLHYNNTGLNGFTNNRGTYTCNIFMSTSLNVQWFRGIHHHSLLDHRQFPQRLQIFGLHTYLFLKFWTAFCLFFFYVTFYRYVLKAGTAWTLKLCYTRFFSLWKLQVLFLIRSETWEIILEFTSPPSQKILFYNKFKYQKHKLNISSVFTLLCFFDLRMKRSSKCCAACRTWHTKTWHTNTWSN